MICWAESSRYALQLKLWEFNVAVASLESEVCSVFATELINQAPEDRDPNIGEWIEIVTQEMGQRSQSLFEKLSGLQVLATTLSSDATELSQQVGRMRVAQLNGRIEIAALLGEWQLHVNLVKRFQTS